MGSIPKVVSTPLKWVSKKVLHHTLLQFPNGSPDSIACTYCPEMCRFSCPTAVTSGNDAVTPCNKMSLLYKEDKWPGRALGGAELWPIYDCTGCGRCTEYCVYSIPVADRLFEARKKFEWKPAKEAAAKITDEMDPVGDLADELGDQESSDRRRTRFFSGNRMTVDEPRTLYFSKLKGHSAKLSWEESLQKEPSEKIKLRLAGKTWLLHESVWQSRNLDHAESVLKWTEILKTAGIKIVRPFASGKDTIDCGGEGAYKYLFASQAKQMASDIWERDRKHVDGILCMSERCAQHFREMNSDLSIESWMNLIQSE